MSHILCSMESERKISLAHFNHYLHGYHHPDRIMSEHDLIYLCEGEWEIELEDITYLLQKDMVLFLPAGVHHFGRVKCLEGTRTMFFHVSAEGDNYIRKDTEKNIENISMDDQREIPLCPLTDCCHAPNVKRFFEDIIAEMASGHAFREYRLSSLVRMLLVELYRIQLMGTDSRKDTLVEETIRIIRENPDHFHTVKELSDLLHVSPRTLTGHFGKVMGTTLHRYEMEQKLEAAASFLWEYPGVKLHEVAQNFGFYDEFHLSRAFSRKFHVSPAVYRKNER